jgi:hypothetical protein
VNIYVTIQGEIVVTEPTDSEGEIVNRIDLVMEELEKLDVVDPMIDLDLGRYALEISVAVEAANPFEAVQQAHLQVRTALHAAEIGTPDWPEIDPYDARWGVVVTHVSADSEEEHDDVNDCEPAGV